MYSTLKVTNCNDPNLDKIHEELQQYYGTATGNAESTDSGNHISDTSDPKKLNESIQTATTTAVATITTTDAITTKRSDNKKSNNSNGKDVNSNNYVYKPPLNVERFLLEYDSTSSIKVNQINIPRNVPHPMQKVALILEWANQDRRALIVQTCNSQVEFTVKRLRNFGFWAFALTNRTDEVEKVAQEHSVFCTPVTTIDFLLENLDLLKSASVVINFDTFWKHTAFLERYMRYKVTNAKKPGRKFACELYQMPLEQCNDNPRNEERRYENRRNYYRRNNGSRNEDRQNENLRNYDRRNDNIRNYERPNENSRNYERRNENPRNYERPNENSRNYERRNNAPRNEDRRNGNAK